MSETLWKVLGCVGMAAIGGAIALVCAFVVSEIRDNIAIKRRDYEYKHRFDKPPLAKCYCKDCLYRSSDGTCDKLGSRYVNEDDFCNRASPCDGEVKWK